MGLFSNNKKLCPICGNPTPRLFSTKVEDMPICKECDQKVDLPNGALDAMSLDDFREYIHFYEENQVLRDIFTETYSYHMGFVNGYLVLDGNNGLFRLRNNDAGIVFETANLKGFRILEDNKPLFESSGNVLKCYESDVPEKVNGMSTQIAQFRLQVQEYEMWERMERMQRERERDDDNRNPPPMHRPRPHFEMTGPFRHFIIEFKIEHPYWGDYRWEKNAPTFSTTDPNIDRYLQEYEEMVNGLHELASALMQMLCPGAQEIYDNGGMAGQQVFTQAAPQANAEANVIEQLQQYKALLDVGILTEEEFSAKKRQLLGL